MVDGPAAINGAFLRCLVRSSGRVVPGSSSSRLCPVSCQCVPARLVCWWWTRWLPSWRRGWFCRSQSLTFPFRSRFTVLSVCCTLRVFGLSAAVGKRSLFRSLSCEAEGWCGWWWCQDDGPQASGLDGSIGRNPLGGRRCTIFLCGRWAVIALGTLFSSHSQRSAPRAN